MDHHSTFVADRLEHDRAATLLREIELRRSVVDRGVTIAPERPVVSAIAAAGLWFRSLVSARPRPSFSL